MHWLLFIHKILFSSKFFEPQVLIFRRIQLYTCRIWYCHSLWEWQYHILHVYNCILLKMSSWGSKNLEENNILWINNNQCIKFVINYSQFMLHGQKNIKLSKKKKKKYCHSLREWQYHVLHVYNCILLKMSTWGSKHVQENNILWINNNQCIKLVINI